MAKGNKIGKVLKQYSMVIILVAIAVLFQILTQGLMFTNTNLTNIILQNSYVVIMVSSVLIVAKPL